MIKSIICLFFVRCSDWREKLRSGCWISFDVTHASASTFNKSCNVQHFRFGNHLTSLLPFFELSGHFCSSLYSWHLRKNRLGESKVFFVNFLCFAFFILVMKAIFEWAAQTWFDIALNLVNVLEIGRPSRKIHFAWVHFLNFLKNQAVAFVEVKTFLFFVESFVHLSVFLKNSNSRFSFWVIRHCTHTTTTLVTVGWRNNASFRLETSLQRIILPDFS